MLTAALPSCRSRRWILREDVSLNFQKKINIFDISFPTLDLIGLHLALVKIVETRKLSPDAPQVPRFSGEK